MIIVGHSNFLKLFSILSLLINILTHLYPSIAQESLKLLLHLIYQCITELVIRQHIVNKVLPLRTDMLIRLTELPKGLLLDLLLPLDDHTILISNGKVVNLSYFLIHLCLLLVIIEWYLL